MATKKAKIKAEPTSKKRRKKYYYSEGRGYRKGYGKPVPRTAGALYSSSETKYWDTDRPRVDIPACTATALTAASTTSPDSYQTLFSPNQGTGVASREGRKTALKKLRIVGAIEYPGQSGQNQYDEAIFVRVVVYLDKQANGTSASLPDIFRTAPLSVGVHAAIRQPMATGSFGRFRIFKDKLFKFDNYQTIGLTSSFVQMPQIQPFKFTIKFKKPLVFLYNSVGGTAPSALLNYNINLQANATVNSLSPQAQCFINYQSRATFFDV